MHSKVIVILFFFSGLTLGQESTSDEAKKALSSYSVQIQESLKELKDLSAQDYFKKIDRFRTDLEKYFEHKKRVCEGEFSTIILSDGGLKRKTKSSAKKVKLSNDERKLCFRELKALQVTFVNNMYIARKRYLEFLHTRRMGELSQAREESIKSIRESFDKR